MGIRKDEDLFYDYEHEAFEENDENDYHEDYDDLDYNIIRDIDLLNDVFEGQVDLYLNYLD